MKSDQRAREHFWNWRHNRTPDETQLQMLALDLEEKHFADLRLVAPSIRRQLLQYDIQGDDGRWHKTEVDGIDVSISEWIFTYRRSRKWNGFCEYKRRNISIKPNLPDIEHRATVLHEMIHAYESQLTPSFREWLLIYLYPRAAKRIGTAKLRRYMTASTHVLFHEGQHGLLFLLKSLQLDWHFRWKPGTVFGYGREDYFR